MTKIFITEVMDWYRINKITSKTIILMMRKTRININILQRSFVIAAVYCIILIFHHTELDEKNNVNVFFIVNGV